MKNLISVNSYDTPEPLLFDLTAAALARHPWLALNERQNHKRLYVFRPSGELLIFRKNAFDQLTWQLDPRTRTLTLQKNNFEVSHYSLMQGSADLLVWHGYDHPEELILVKADYGNLNKLTAPAESIDLTCIRQQIQNDLFNLTDTNLKRFASMKKSAYDLYVERKTKMLYLTLGKKILTYLGYGSTGITLLLFTFIEVVDQPQALLNGIPYSLTGMAICFIGIQVLNSKLAELKKNKKSRTKQPLTPAGSF